MTSPADQDVDNKLGGAQPGGGVLAYQFNPECLGLVTYSSDDNVGPYTTEFTEGDPVVGSAATYDQARSVNVLQGSRHVDPRGNLATPKKAWLIQWYWMQDGCPTPLPLARLQQYIAWADVERPWPTTITEGFAAKGYTLPTSEGAPHDYSAVANAATLDDAVAGGPSEQTLAAVALARQSRPQPRHGTRQRATT